MRRFLRILGLLLSLYILQTTVLPRVTSLSVRPDLLLCLIVALTLDGDRVMGYNMGAAVGLLMDAMVGQLAFLYLIAYPLMGFFASRLSPWITEHLPDAKKKRSDRKQMVLLGSIHVRDLTPAITAGFLTAMYESALLVYRYLNGVDITWRPVGIMLRSALYTAISAFFVQYIVRFSLRPRTKRKQRGERPEPVESQAEEPTEEPQEKQEKAEGESGDEPQEDRKGDDA